MMMRNVFTFFGVTLTLYSCDNSKMYRPTFMANSCIKEINRSYASIDTSPISIYKLDEIKKFEDDSPKLKVSFWHNNSWFYQGVKNFDHFDNTKLFKYESVDCPDGSDKNIGITDRLKKIDI